VIFHILIVRFFEIGLFLLIVLRYFLSNAPPSFYSLLLPPFRSIDRSSNIFVAEPASRRRELAVTHGATRVFDPAGCPGDSLSAEVQNANNGFGVDFAFDAAGVQASIDAGLMSLRPRGIFINVAGWEHSPRVNMNLILIKEITLTGKPDIAPFEIRRVDSLSIATVCYNGIHPEMLAAVASGKINGISDLITRKISLDNLVSEGLLALLNQKETQGAYYFVVFLPAPLTALTSQNSCTPLRQINKVV